MSVQMSLQQSFTPSSNAQRVFVKVVNRIFISLQADRFYVMCVFNFSWQSQQGNVVVLTPWVRIIVLMRNLELDWNVNYGITADTFFNKRVIAIVHRWRVPFTKSHASQVPCDWNILPIQAMRSCRKTKEASLVLCSFVDKWMWSLPVKTYRLLINDPPQWNPFRPFAEYGKVNFWNQTTLETQSSRLEYWSNTIQGNSSINVSLPP